MVNITIVHKTSIKIPFLLQIWNCKLKYVISLSQKVKNNLYKKLISIISEISNKINNISGSINKTGTLS